MKELYEKLGKSLEHLCILNDVFSDVGNFNEEDMGDHHIYRTNCELIKADITKLDFGMQLYSEKGRQMMLADLIEYILIGRGYYSLGPKSKEDREVFVRLILHFVNLLMCYEAITVSNNTRKKVLQALSNNIPELKKEERFAELLSFEGKVGLKQTESDAPKYLDNYFDTWLPKTAGGLWHELLVYIFLIRSDVGFIVPLTFPPETVAL